MKKKVCSFMLLILLMMPLPVYARAGGGSSGGSGGGGGSSSSSSHHHYYNGNRNSSPFGSLLSIIGVFGVIIFIPSIPMIVYRNRVRKKSKQTKEILESIQSADSVWKEEDILRRTEDIYYHVQNAWTNTDIEALKPYLTPHLYEQWKMKLTWQEMRKERNVLEDIKLLKKAIVNVKDYQDDSQDCCWLYIEGSMKDYTVNTETQEVIEGIKKQTSFVEYWKLLRIEDEFYLDEILQKEDISPENFIDRKEES